MTRIFGKKTKFYSALEINNLKPPNKAVFVGDDAFSLATYLMKPYSIHEGLEHKQKICNYRLSRACRIVENALLEYILSFLTILCRSLLGTWM